MPILETDQGSIFSAGAIARYIARLRRDTGLCGQNFVESGVVDSWLEFASEIERPLSTWTGIASKVLSDCAGVLGPAKADTEVALSIVDKHLLESTYMVGHQITLADIAMCCAVLEGMSSVLDAAFLQTKPNFKRWFETCINQPEFVQVLGRQSFPWCVGSASTSSAHQSKEKPSAPAKEKPVKAPVSTAKPAAAPKVAPAPQSTNGPAVDPALAAKIDAAGLHVRKLKEEKADKAAIDAAVAELLALKKEAGVETGKPKKGKK
jgi:elongation factor 1-gamma